MKNKVKKINKIKLEKTCCDFCGKSFDLSTSFEAVFEPTKYFPAWKYCSAVCKVKHDEEEKKCELKTKRGYKMHMPQLQLATFNFKKY